MDQDWISSFEALKSVYIDGAYSNMALNQAISAHQGCRDSFVRTFVKGTLRDTLLLDAIIDRLARKGAGSIKKRTLIILRMGLYAVRSMDSVPDYAAVSEAVNLARISAKGTDRFVNAILRSYLRRRSSLEPAPEAAFPPWLTCMLNEQYGSDAGIIMQGLNTPPPLVLRVNLMRTNPAELSEHLRSEGISTYVTEESGRALIAAGGNVTGSEFFRKGHFTIQSLPSILAIEALGVTPGSAVLDMCSAPGGKTAMMAEMMEDRGSITACDIHPHRLELVTNTAERLGCSVISTRLLDGTEHVDAWDERFDYVLADVPCSGIGVMGTKPEIRFRTDMSELGDLIRTQENILYNALSYVKRGGLVCYSTCTLNKEENEGVAFRVRDRMCESLSFVRIVEMKTFLPYNNSIGFYYCILKKDV